MGPDRFRDFTRRVLEHARREPAVVGLVALGSTADLERPPDEHSDHDLWIVTRSGEREAIRTRTDWLPDPERIVLRFRETEHGMKALYEDGHLVEYAVFSIDELDLARANVFRVLLDRADVTERVRRCAAATAGEPLADLEWLFGQALTHLVVGVERDARGEHLSGHRFVRERAVERIVALLDRLAPAPEGSRDNLDPYRRIERAHPAQARAIEDAVRRPVREAARRLLGVLVSLAVGRGELPGEAVARVRARWERLDRLSGGSEPEGPAEPSPRGPR